MTVKNRESPLSTLKTVLLILGVLAAAAAVIFVLIFGVPAGMYALLSIDWVASGLFLAVFTFVVFRYGLHWGTDGAIVLVVGIGVVAAFLDFRGNPIYNLPYELLFLDDGHRLSF